MKLYRLNGEFFLETNRGTYRIADAILDWQISEENANIIMADINKRFPNMNDPEPRGWYVEKFVPLEVEQEDQKAKVEMKKTYENLWNPDLSALSTEHLKQLIQKALSIFGCNFNVSDVYARHRDEQRLSNSPYSYSEVDSLKNERAAVERTLESSDHSQNKDILIKALKQFQDFARKFYIYATTHDTKDYEYTSAHQFMQTYMALYDKLLQVGQNSGSEKKELGDKQDKSPTQGQIPGLNQQPGPVLHAFPKQSEGGDAVAKPDIAPQATTGSNAQPSNAANAQPATRGKSFSGQ